MNGERIHFQLDLRFPGGNDNEEEFDLSVAAAGGFTDCDLVISTLPDLLPEHRERIVESIQLGLMNWCEQHGVAPIVDPSPEIWAIVDRLCPAAEQVAPSAIQRTNFGRFQKWPLRESGADVIRRVIALGGLNPSDIGILWGVTVFPKASRAIRLNVGRRIAADVWSDGHLRLCAIGEQPDVSLSDGVEMGAGFDRIKESYCLIAEAGEATEMVLADPEVARHHRRFIEVDDHQLLNRNWHNPLTVPLLNLS